MGNIYVLYGGSSEDGRGTPKYLRKTTDKEEAKKHYKKVSENPYSTGKVVILGDAEEQADRFTDWDAL